MNSKMTASAKRRKKGRALPVIGVTVIAAVAPGLALQPFLAQALILVLALFVLPLVPVGTFAFGYLTPSQDLGKAGIRAAQAFGLGLLFLATASIVTYLRVEIPFSIHDHQIRASLPALDAFKQTHGHYPESLSELGDRAPGISANISYRTVDDGRRFIFSQPDELGMMSWHEFDSDHREWRQFD